MTYGTSPAGPVTSRTDRQRYGADYGGGGPVSVPTDDEQWDGLQHSVAVLLRPYSALILSQDR